MTNSIRHFISIIENAETGILPEPEHVLAPDIGARFEYHGRPYTVTGWMREAPPLSDHGDLLDDMLYSSQQELGPRKQKLVWCQRNRATLVSGKGVGGCVAPVDMIKVTGRAPISRRDYKDMLQSQIRRVGDPVG